MWQRIALMNDETRLLITVHDDDPDTIEVCVRPMFADRWGPPLPIEVPR